MNVIFIAILLISYPAHTLKMFFVASIPHIIILVHGMKKELPDIVSLNPVY